MSNADTISFIIPCYNSERTIKRVIDEITQNVEGLGFGGYEIITVNDCSSDGVSNVLYEIAEENKNVKVIELAKNYGQHVAMIAGIQNSIGSICVFLDDDGQCPIDCLDKLIRPLYNGWDVSIASYKKKKQSLFKNMGSKFNDLISRVLIDNPNNIQTSNFIAVNRFVADEMAKYKGPFPYISGLIFRSSNKIVNVPMEERFRLEGRTTYSIKKLIVLWLSSFTAFSIKPLRIATMMGLSCSLIGLIFSIVVVIRKILTPQITMGWSSIISIILLLGGMVLFVLGIIGEYIGRIYMSVNGTPQYIISKNPYAESGKGGKTINEVDIDNQASSEVHEPKEIIQ